MPFENYKGQKGNVSGAAHNTRAAIKAGTHGVSLPRRAAIKMVRISNICLNSLIMLPLINTYTPHLLC